MDASSRSLPRLSASPQHRASGGSPTAPGADPSARNVSGGARFLGRMSWDRDLLDVSPADIQGALSHSPQRKTLAALQSTPSPPPHSPSRLLPQPTALMSLSRSETTLRQQHRSSAVLSTSGSSSVVGFAGPSNSRSMSFQESMAEVEKLLDENVRSRYYDHCEKSPQQPRGGALLTPQPTAAKRTFAFAPLLDPLMLVATAAQDAQLAEDERDAGHGESSGDVSSPEHGTGCITSSRSGDDDCNSDGDDEDPDAGVTTEVKLKYFGAAAKSAYYKTYQELHGKPHLFVETHASATPTQRQQQRTPARSSRPDSIGTPVSPPRLAAVLSPIGIANDDHSSSGSGSGGDWRDAESSSPSDVHAAHHAADDGALTPTPNASLARRRQALQSPGMSGITTAASGASALRSLESSPSLHSPRVLFLAACVAQSHPALSVLIRKDNCRSYDFSHQGLGDAFAVQFAACLPDLPLVEAINVRANRLSDAALNCLLLALENKPNLATLDISENEMGARSAESLRNYIASSLCTLKTLTMNNADVDDRECTLFMLAFEKNKSVEHLFLRSNRIGQVVAAKAKTGRTGKTPPPPGATSSSSRSLPTGGEAIGAMLNVNLTIATLDLAWNLLKCASASPIGSALQLNYNLRELNVSYNACGDQGAMVFGHTLRVNSALEKLDLSYNSIGAKGAMVLASGLAANRRLRELVLDGNAIGLESGRALMHASCTRAGGGGASATCRLSLFECSLTTTSTVTGTRFSGRQSGGSSDAAGNATKEMTLFNPADPTGAYALDLSDPYENMIAHELLRIATFKAEFCFAKLEYAPASTTGAPGAGGSGGGRAKIELSRRGKKRAPDAASEASEQQHGLLLQQNQSPVALLFAQIDKDRSGSVDCAELVVALRAYGFSISEERLSHLVSEYDYDHSGSLQEDEFHDLFFRCGFAMVDADHSGSLNADEIAVVLRFMGVQDMSPLRIKRMIAQYDLDGSGEIDESEFLEFMKAETFQSAAESDESREQKNLDEAYEAIALREASGAIWKVPAAGLLSVEFAKDHHDHDDVESSSGGSGGQAGGRRRRSTAFRPSQNVSDAAIAKLVSSVQGMSRNSSEQADFLNAVLADSELLFTASQAEHLLEKQGELKSTTRKLAALVRILPQMTSRREAIALTVRVFDPRKQWQERFALRRQLGSMYVVLLGSLTNKYSFDLASSADRAALQKLALIAQEEKLFSKNRSGRSDTSQHGNWENFRHATIDGKMVLLTSTYILNALLAPASASSLASRAAGGAVGRDGAAAAAAADGRQRVEFFYVSTTRPPRGTKSLTPRRFEQLLEVLSEPIGDDSVGHHHHHYQHKLSVVQAADNEALDKTRQNALMRWQLVRSSLARFSAAASSEHSGASYLRPDLFRVKCTVDGVQQKLAQLEMLVCDRWLHSQQAAELVAAFPNVLQARAQAACILFGRLVDVENFVVIYDTLSPEDQHECTRRLGWLNIFDPTQPDRQFPPLDLSVRDERELVQILAQLAQSEGQATWQDPAYYIGTRELSGQPGPPTTLLPSDELPPAGWGNAQATGEQSLKHHGLVCVRFQTITHESAAENSETSESPRRADHLDAHALEFRSQLRSRVLCGTRLYL